MSSSAAKSLTLLAMALLPAALHAHSAKAVLDPGGDKATFTGLARVTCFDDGSGPAAYLMARVRDNSPPVAGLLVNLQLLKGSQAISISDTVSGDAQYSDFAALPGGNGVYTMLLNKTRAGARSFELEWHCMTAADLHTGTDIILDQYQ